MLCLKAMPKKSALDEVKKIILAEGGNTLDRDTTNHVLSSLSQTPEVVETATAVAATVEEGAEVVTAEEMQGKLSELEQSLSAQYATQLEELKIQTTQTLEELKASSQTAIATAVEETEQKADQALADLQAKLTAAEEKNASLEGLFALTGNPNPVTASEANSNGGVGSNVNLLIGSKSDKPEGAYAEVLQLFDSADKISKFSAKQGGFTAYDGREVKQYIRANKAAVIQAMENWGRHNGLFRGPNARISKQAATTKVDVDGGFLDTLSVIMRETHRPGYVFWQFPTVQIDFQRGMGDTIQIPRAEFLPRAQTINDRRLSGAGTFVNIDPGSQPIVTGTVPAVIEEWGLGANSTFAPVGIPTFVQAYSMIDLIQVLQDNLLEDYWSWEDLAIRSLWAPTSRVVYNANNEVTTTPGDVVATADGTFTENFANSLNAYARTLLIKPLRDGCYGLVVPTQVAKTYKNSLSTNNAWQAPNEMNLRELLNILNPEVIGEIGRISGYLGKWSNFHMFETNAYGVGAPGSEGVQTEALGVGATTTRTSYLFGRATIGRGIGTEMEIIMDNSGTFGRLERYIWREESGFTAVDVDPVGYGQTPGDPGVQQLRVIAVHTTDVAV